jgi:hypothetical protein
MDLVLLNPCKQILYHAPKRAVRRITMSFPSFSMPLKYSVLIAISASLAACATNTPAPVTQKAGPEVRYHQPSNKHKSRQKISATTPGNNSGTIQQTREGLPGAVTSPLTDLNLKKPIPPDYLENLGYVYTVNRGLNCREIARQIGVLDAALGDIDTDILAAQERARRSNSVSKTTLEVIGGIASSIIPLRPVVRTATGARKAKSHYEERFDNGRRRRSFLKGYGLAKRCKPPAAPLITYAPNFGKTIPGDPNRPNKSWNDSRVPPAGR